MKAIPSSDEERLLFHEVLDRAPAERAAFLDSTCAGKVDLRARLEDLLKAHDEAGEFLASPTAGGSDAPATEKPGQRIGRYKLQQVIGEGGFGTVWMAEQQEPVRRQVALKIIKRGLDTKQVIARFEAERQALALMDHPNIAKVFDGGETPSGMPFFVMELVRGEPITTFCDQHHLDSAHRLDLFTQVCNAVQHAHQKGIIHRDLKPSNVMVELHDVVPVVKVIDFGIAKATSRRLTDRTMFTEFRQMMGTPAYMSPEQAEVSGLDIDTRADVYSLGVLLYELLTGTTPFASVQERGMLEMLRIIREEDAPKPSTRISTLGEAITSVAKCRRVEPRKLRRLVQGDLDWIVMKALEKDRARRYETASAFAEDVRRHLLHEPVMAGPPGTGYRLRKYVRRHRVGVTAGAMVATALLVGLGAAAWGFHDAREQRDRAVGAEQNALAQASAATGAKEVADQERARAEAGEASAKKEASRASTVLGFVEDMLGSADPDNRKGKDFTVRQMLDDFDRGLGARLSSEPEVEVSVRHLLGKAYHVLGIYDKAAAHLRQMLAINRQLRGEDSLDTATSLNNLAECLLCQGKLAEAEELHRQVLAMSRKHLGVEHLEVARSLHNLSSALQEQGKLAEAEELQRQALAMGRRLLGDEHAFVALCLHNLAVVLRDQGKYAEAEEMSRQALAMLRKVQGDESPTVASSLNNFALVLHSQGKFAEAEEVQRQSLAMQRKLLGDEHPHVALSLSHLSAVLHVQGKSTEAEAMQRQALAMSLKVLGEEHPAIASIRNNLADVLNAQGKVAEAEELHRQALAMRRRILGDEHPEVAASLNNLGTVLLKQGRLVEAEELHRQALALLRKLLGDEHPNVAASLHNLATVHNAQGKRTEAEALLKQAIDMRRRLLGTEHPDVVWSLVNLAAVLFAQGKQGEAVEIQRQLLTIARRRYAGDDPEIAGALAQLGFALMQQDKFTEAEEVLRECLAIRTKRLPDNWLTNNSMSLLGGALARQGRHDEADPLLREGFEKMQPPPEHAVRRREALERLIQHYDAWGKPEQTAVYRKLLEKSESK